MQRLWHSFVPLMRSPRHPAQSDNDEYSCRSTKALQEEMYNLHDLSIHATQSESEWKKAHAYMFPDEFPEEFPEEKPGQ